MAYHESLLLTLFDVVFYLLIAKKILEIREFFWKDLVPLVVLVFSVATGSFFVPDQFNFFISTISFVIVFLIYFKLTFFQSLMLYVISIIIMIVIQLIAMIPTYFIFNGIETAFIPGLVAQSIGLIMVLICYMFVSVHLIYRLANKKNRVVKVLLFNIFLLAVGVLFYWFVDVDGMLENSLVFIGISLSLVILNVSVKYSLT